MHRLSVRSLVVALVASGLVGWLAWTWFDRTGATPIRVPWTMGAVCLAVAVVALWQGWSVRQYVAGKRPGLDPLKAARTVVLAQASAYGGAVLSGALGGYAIALAAQWGHAPRRELAIATAIGAACALVLLVAGWVAERWCRIDPPEGNGSEATGGTLAT